MNWRVEFAEYASRDILDCYNWIADADGESRAMKVMIEIVDAAIALSTFPRRGQVVAMEAYLLPGEYRQIQKHGFKIIYRIDDDVITVAAVLHERRDINATLRARQIPDEPIT